MNAVNRVRTALRVDVMLPVTRVGFGPFSFDPVEQLLGAPVAEILQSLMVAPVRQQPSAAGPPVNVYPLALPDGEGASFELGGWGELGFFNDGGLLVLTLPSSARSWACGQLGRRVVRVEEALGADDRPMAQLWVQLKPGAEAVLPIGGIGGIGLRIPA